MAQLRCCTAPVLLWSHLYKSDAIDIERIDTSIREKHAKQLVFFLVLLPSPWLFFTLCQVQDRRKVYHSTVWCTHYVHVSPFDIFPWQKHTQHGIKMMISITVVNHLMCVCAKWHKLQQMGEAKRIKDLNCVFSPFHFKMALQKPLLLLLWV